MQATFTARKTVTIIGAGNVGATAAFLVANGGIDVRLVDVVDGLAQGKAIDIGQALAVNGVSASIEGGTDFALLRGSDVVVVTAGLARKPGMSRSDLLHKNAAIVKSVAGEIHEKAPEAVVLVVTNPLDVMTYVMLRETGLPASRVVGMGGVLDSGRMKYFTARATGVSPGDVHVAVIGSHGDGMMPVTSSALVGSAPLRSVLADEDIEAVSKRTGNGGAEIVSYLKTGSAYFAPAAAINVMVRTVVLDQKRVVPACVLLDGQHGQNDVCLGLPVVLGAAGVEKVFETELDDAEQAALSACAEAVRSDIDQLEL